MLGIGGKFASSKGMVEVPAIVGLSRSNAESAIRLAGLVVGTISSDSGSSSQDNTVKTQSIQAGTLVDYESVIPFTIYVYTPPPEPSGPYVINTEQISATCAYVQTNNTGTSCIGTTKVTYYISYQYTEYRRYWSDGTTDTYLSYCGQNAGSFEQQNSTDCGYVPPAPKPLNCGRCVSSYNVAISTGSCASGRGWYSVCYHEDGCYPSVTETSVNCIPLSQIPEPEPCACTASCGSVWSGSCGGTIAGERLYAQRCTDCDCNQTVSRWSEPC